jgi:hypothetical protein
MGCFGAFLASVPWSAAGEAIPLHLTTQLADNDPRKKDQLSADRQKSELEARVSQHPLLRLELHRRHPKYSPIHMRFIHFVLAGGESRLFVLERGLDVINPKTGTARDDSYFLEFVEPPPELAAMMNLLTE